METVVAGAAIIGSVIFPEVIEEQFSAALAGLGVRHRFLQELFADFLLCHGFPLHEFFQFLDILVTVVGNALAFLAVTTGPARLLIIALDALGDVVVDDKAHVRLVDSHAEGDGGHDDVDLLHQELVLVLGPGFGVQAGMVGQGPDSVDGEHLGHLFHLFAAQAIDDAGFAGVLADEADDVFLRFHLVPHLIVQIGPVEGRFEHFGVLDAEILEDVALHLGRGGGGEGNDRSRLDFLDDGADFPVFRTEIMPPFRDTMGLVHGVEGNLDALEEGDVFLLGKGLRGHVQQFGDTPPQVFLNFLNLDFVEGRIEEMGDPGLAGLEPADDVHLVFHEGDERGYHNSRSLHDQCRQLVTQRFASPRRHQNEGIVPGYQMPDNLLLVCLESIVPEEGFQFGVKKIWSGHSSSRFSASPI